MDRLTSLAVFRRVVECNGFSAASRRLNMSVTMVSSHVQALEERLGVRLLNRSTRKISLTETGRAYYERSVRILDDLDDADRIASESDARPRGNLRVYTNSSMVPFLTPIMHAFLTLHPQVTMDLIAGEPMIDLIQEGFDLAIRTRPMPDSSLIVRTLARWQHVLSCAPGYLQDRSPPAQLEDLAAHNCLRYIYSTDGDDWRFERQDGSTAFVQVTGNLVTNSPEALLALALAGLGILLAPSFVVADDLAEGRLVRLLPDYRPPSFAVNAIYPHRHNLSTKVRSFIDLLALRFIEREHWMDLPLGCKTSDP